MRTTLVENAEKDTDEGGHRFHEKPLVLRFNFALRRWAHRAGRRRRHIGGGTDLAQAPALIGRIWI